HRWRAGGGRLRGTGAPASRARRARAGSVRGTPQTVPGSSRRARNPGSAAARGRVASGSRRPPPLLDGDTLLLRQRFADSRRRSLAARHELGQRLVADAPLVAELLGAQLARVAQAGDVVLAHADRLGDFGCRHPLHAASTPPKNVAAGTPRTRAIFTSSSTVKPAFALSLRLKVAGATPVDSARSLPLIFRRPICARISAATCSLACSVWNM